MKICLGDVYFPKRYLFHPLALLRARIACHSNTYFQFYALITGSSLSYLLFLPFNLDRYVCLKRTASTNSKIRYDGSTIPPHIDEAVKVPFRHKKEGNMEW